MLAIRLVHLIEDHADKLAEGLQRKLQTSPRCRELVRRVPADELKTRTHEVYRHLSEWLVDRTGYRVEERYLRLGMRRARQRVPFSEVFWGMCATKQHLWDYLQREGLLDGPVELWGEMELLHSLERFFDSALYFAAIGYERAGVEEEAGEEAGVARR
jgi:hypothetical protein